MSCWKQVDDNDKDDNANNCFLPCIPIPMPFREDEPLNLFEL